MSGMGYEGEHQLDHLISRNLGAKHTWVVRMSVEECSDFLGRIVDTPLEYVASLGGIPISCTDLRVAGEQAHTRGKAVVCDNTLATSFGCAAARLGADIVCEELTHVLGKHGKGLIAVSLSGDFLSAHLNMGICLDLENVADVLLAPLGLDYLRWDDERKRQNDAALAIAEYLVCHPKVAHVWYPGLLRDQRDSSRTDPANAQAPNILLGGFGPVVDFELAPDALRGATPHVGRKSPLRALDGRLMRLVCTQQDAVAQAQAVEQALATI